MKETNHSDDWRSLCESPSKETNPQKMLELITRINRALEDCRQRSRAREVLFRVDENASRAYPSHQTFRRWAKASLDCDRTSIG